jgi:hypothetical protein
MKKIIAASLAVASLAFASGAFAQTAPAAPAAAASGALTLDTPIETIAANPAGKAVLDKDLPGLTTHAMYDQFKSMSLKDLQPMSQGAVSDEALKKTGEDLAKIKS